MPTKTIKVIKRGERQRQDEQTETPVKAKTGRAAAQVAAREMVSTVSTWVSEFQQKRRTETTRAFKSLFADATPQPTEI
ncbi:MAG TPA: hypothetical protein VM870_00520 [Pyrinomonadaceae bacterium]|jgi:hypothetical protein|nr:hypothetical protein [Pyrinomonadaceae bacterium]